MKKCLPAYVRHIVPVCVFDFVVFDDRRPLSGDLVAGCDFWLFIFVHTAFFNASFRHYFFPSSSFSGTSSFLSVFLFNHPLCLDEHADSVEGKTCQYIRFYNNYAPIYRHCGQNLRSDLLEMGRKYAEFAKWQNITPVVMNCGGSFFYS